MYVVRSDRGLPGTTASFPQGTRTTWQGDRVTYFSSRGPGGDWLKPDVTAPGLHTLAGNTPTPSGPIGGPPGNLFQLDAGVGEALAERLARLRRTRDAGRTAHALDALEAGARGRDNLMPLLVEAVEASATLGEICERLRAVFGVHQPSVTF